MINLKTKKNKVKYLKEAVKFLVDAFEKDDSILRKSDNSYLAYKGLKEIFKDEFTLIKDRVCQFDMATPAGDYHFSKEQNLAVNNLLDIYFCITHNQDTFSDDYCRKELLTIKKQKKTNKNK